MGTVLQLTATDFEQKVKKSNGVYLVDFWAPWCGPCRMMGPILEEYATKQTKIKVAKVNVDENPSLAQEFGITGIPTMIIFKDGKEAQRISGVVQLNVLEQKLSSYN
ncbi:MAG: thioredoxin [Proteobacteria bacterium]|nr:thioredoxin [Pseudomonadota bacterium]